MWLEKGCWLAAPSPGNGYLGLNDTSDTAGKPPAKTNATRMPRPRAHTRRVARHAEGLLLERLHHLQLLLEVVPHPDDLVQGGGHHDGLLDADVHGSDGVAVEPCEVRGGGG